VCVRGGRGVGFGGLAADFGESDGTFRDSRAGFGGSAGGVTLGVCSTGLNLTCVHRQNPASSHHLGTPLFPPGTVARRASGARKQSVTTYRA